MSGCKECRDKDKTILHLEESIANYRINLHTEMSYPCSFEDREAVDADQKKYTGELT